MHLERRDFLVSLAAALAAVGMFQPQTAMAAELNQGALDAKTIEEALTALGAGTPESSSAVTLVAPDIAENGAVVPVNVTSTLPGTDAIALLVEKNPNPLAAYTSIPAGTEPYVASRVKMQESSRVVALVRANGKFFIASRDVKVTLGGCGG